MKTKWKVKIAWHGPKWNKQTIKETKTSAYCKHLRWSITLNTLYTNTAVKHNSWVLFSLSIYIGWTSHLKAKVWLFDYLKCLAIRLWDQEVSWSEPIREVWRFSMMNTLHCLSGEIPEQKEDRESVPFIKVRSWTWLLTKEFNELNTKTIGLKTQYEQLCVWHVFYFLSGPVYTWSPCVFLVIRYLSDLLKLSHLHLAT